MATLSRFSVAKNLDFYPDIQSQPISGIIREKIRISKVVTGHLGSFYRLKWGNVEIKHFWCMFETPLIPYVFVGRDEADCNYTCISANSRGEKKENRKLKFQMFTQRYAVRPGLHGRIWTGSVHPEHPHLTRCGR